MLYVTIRVNQAPAPELKLCKDLTMSHYEPCTRSWETSKGLLKWLTSHGRSSMNLETGAYTALSLPLALGPAGTGRYLSVKP